MKRWQILLSLAILGIAVIAIVLAMNSDDDAPDIPTAAQSNLTVQIDLRHEGFDGPMQILESPYGPLVVEKAGKIVHLNHTLFLDASHLVELGPESGLFMIAFDPNSNDLYLHGTNPNTRIWRYEFETGTFHVMFAYDQPKYNHNGGPIFFDDEGFLYIAMGDGGGAGDPLKNSQDTTNPHGSLLRFKIENKQLVPAGAGFEHPAIWDYGLRNPWRIHLHEGELWIADVGQYEVEELNRVSNTGGHNFGWSIFEGNQRFKSGAVPNHTRPIATYDHDGGNCAVMGGIIPTNGTLAGHYIMGDFCSGQLWVYKDQLKLLVKTEASPVHFAQIGGDLMMVSVSGEIFQIT